MSVKRSILHYNILRYPDTERSKIPNSLNATGNHCISNALCNFNGNSQHPYMHIVLLHFLYKFIRMKNRNAIQAGSYQSGIHIKSRFVTLKIGDLLFTGTPEGVGPVSVGQHLEGYLEGDKLLDFYIR